MTQNNEQDALHKIMAQVQVYASSYSLVGTMFATDNQLEEADREKLALYNMVKSALSQSPISQNEHQESVGEVVNERGYSEVFVDFFDKPPPPNGTKLYTSPPKQIPDEWKPLSNEQIAEVRESMITDGCLDTVEFANAIYTKLKHINAAPATSLTSETNTEVGE